MTGQQAQTWVQGKRPIFGDAEWLHARAVLQLAAEVTEARAKSNWRCPVVGVEEAALRQELLLWRRREKAEAFL